MVTGDAGRPEPSASTKESELVVDWHGPHAHVRCREEVTEEAGLLSRVPAAPGNLLIITSRAAQAHPELLSAIRDFLVSIWELGVEPRPWAVWLAVPDLGNPDGQHVAWLHGLAAQAGIEVCAPHGEAELLPGAGMYVDRDAGGTGWRRFGPDSFGDVVGCRFPVPRWEHLVPRAPLGTARLVTRPVPAGLAVSAAAPPSRNEQLLALRIPLNPRIPKLVLGGPGADFTPAAVAELLALFPDALLAELVVVPGSVRMTRPEWLEELVWLAGHDVALCPGVQVASAKRGTRTVVIGERGEELLTPFATLFVQRTGTSLPEVLDVAPPPLGWSRAGSRTYTPARDGRETSRHLLDAEVEVVPGGISVHLPGQPANAIPFAPAGWTLGVGTPGTAVTDKELAVARSLLDGLTAEQLRTARVRAFGVMTSQGRTVLDAYVRAVGAVAHEPATMNATASPLRPSAAEVTLTRPEPSAARAVAEPPVAEPAVGEPSVGEPSVVWPSAAGSFAEEPPAAADLPVVTSGGGPVATTSAPEAAPARHELARPVTTSSPEHEEVPVAAADFPVTTATERAVPARPRNVEPIVLADRPSTAAEQARLGESAGPRYTEALATVNVALSAWPMLRPEAKADYIAVCLYLGSGEAGGVSLNEALRTGESVPLDGYAQCLMSGLRRLPTHRQVVLRQENSLDSAHPVGAVLVEQAFLSASTGLDVTTDSAGLDVLIWPVSARRTSELAMGRAMQEAVFPPGRRFKVLSVKTWDQETDETEGLRPPQTALLTRELLAGEQAHSEESAERDHEALERLERAWAARHAQGVWLVDDPDMKARLSLPLLLAAEEEATADEPLGMVS